MLIKGKKCANCKISDWKKLFSSAHATSNQMGYTFYQCICCGLIQLNPFPSHLTTKRLYSFTNTQEHNQKISLLMRLVYLIPGGKNLLSYYIRIVHRNRQRLVEDIIKSGRLLDVGCGTGEFLTLFDPHCWKLAGIEINPYLTKTVKLNSPYIHITNSTIAGFRAQRQFEAITLWHVWEHLPNPALIVKKLHHLLKPDGWLFIEVPQGDSIVRTLFRQHWNLLLTPEHLYFWNATALSHFLITNGFYIKSVSYRGYISSFPGSCGNWLRAHKVPNTLATVIGLTLLPLALVLYVVIPSTRDNLLIIARKKSLSRIS